MKTAILLGATGLTGSQLLDLLLQDKRFRKVIILVRRTVGFTHPKLEEHIIDFDQPNFWAHLVQGDILFSAFGTTLKKAGSQEMQYEVDYHYQYQTAAAAARNGVHTYVVVSAQGANENSPFFYMRMKGDLDRDVQLLPFQKIRILRPGMLDGNRQENRTMENLGLNVIKFFNNLGLFRSLQPIHVRQLAQAMIEAALEETPGAKIYDPDDLFALTAHPA